MKDVILYVHGKGGNAAESGHYKPLFPGREVIGLDYQGATPWEAGAEIREAVEKLKNEYESITLIAVSIGAYFAMNAGIDGMLSKAYFISPIVDMERLIADMIRTGFGEDLSWEYLCHVREHPIKWSVPTSILYGNSDNMTSLETIRAFAKAHGAVLTVMENGEHWFHTEEQMQFLDEWIRENEEGVR